MWVLVVLCMVSVFVLGLVSLGWLVMFRSRGFSRVVSLLVSVVLFVSVSVLFLVQDSVLLVRFFVSCVAFVVLFVEFRLLERGGEAVVGN